jgi:quinol monooxygenase YgiN
MIVRTWSGRVPSEHGAGFHEHLLATGVADYRAQPGCVDVRLWCSDDGVTATFTLVSIWTDLSAIRAYAGDRPEIAVLYPEDGRFGLEPDRNVRHHTLLLADPRVSG